MNTVNVHIKSKHNGKNALEMASATKDVEISKYLQSQVLKQPLTVISAPSAAAGGMAVAAAPAAVPQYDPATAPLARNGSVSDHEPVEVVSPSDTHAPSDTSSSPTADLADQDKAWLGDWALAALRDCLARVRSRCAVEINDQQSSSALNLPFLVSVVADHLGAVGGLAGAPWAATIADAASTARGVAQSIASFASLRDELASGKSGKSLPSRVNAVPTHGMGELESLRDALLARASSQSQRMFDPRIPRSDLVIDKRPFARGAFSKAHRGTFQGTPIVAKVFKTDGLAVEDLKVRVAREADAMAKCQHPNIVRCFGVCADFDDEGEDPFVALVMDPYPEGTLTDLMRRHEKGLPGPLAAHILEGVAWGLDALHRQGVVHKDLKTDNILILKEEEELHGVVADFGLSVDLAFSSAQYNLTGGTVTYQAPEQLRPVGPDGKELRLTNKVDMYAFGVVAWCLACNDEPWRGMSVNAIYQIVGDLGQRPTFPPPRDQCWRQIQHLASQCFDADPNKRPTAIEAARSLREAARLG